MTGTTLIASQTSLTPRRADAAAVNPYHLAPLAGQRPPAPEWFETALKIEPERGTFAVPHGEIELLTWGELGKPGLLFLHGYAGHADWWSFIAPQFAQDYRCAAISLSGMGRSSRRPDGIYDFADWAEDAFAAIDAAGLNASGQRPVVIAQSMAGFVSLLAAIRHDPFAGLIAIDTGFRTHELPEAERLRLNQGHKDRLFPTIAEALARYRLSPDQPCDNLYVLDHLARLSLKEEEGGRGWRWRLDPKMSTDLRMFWSPALLDQVPCPMAYFYGERSALVSHRIGEIRAALKPGTQVVGIPDADHNVLADQPLALVSAIRAILAGWTASGRIVG